MGHYEIEHPGEEIWIVHCLAKLPCLQPGQGKEAPQHVRFGGKPAENGHGRLLRGVPPDWNVFGIVSHCPEMVTSFSTKWPYRRPM